MSLHYLLDGYNIIKQIPELAPKKLEDGRRALVRAIEVHQPQGSSQNSVTIVFDGQPGIFGAVNTSIVRVIFSEGESADDKIKNLVEQSHSKKNMVVVTDDRDIKFAVRPGGVRVMAVKEFWAKMVPKKLQREFSRTISKIREREEEKSISKTLEHKITSEFEKIWLEKKDPNKSSG